MDAGRIAYNDATFRAMVLDLLQKTGRTLDDLKREFFSEVVVAEVTTRTAAPECKYSVEELLKMEQADTEDYDVSALVDEGRALSEREREEALTYAITQVDRYEYPGKDIPRRARRQ